MPWMRQLSLALLSVIGIRLSLVLEFRVHLQPLNCVFTIVVLFCFCFFLQAKKSWPLFLAMFATIREWPAALYSNFTGCRWCLHPPFPPSPLSSPLTSVRSTIVAIVLLHFTGRDPRSHDLLKDQYVWSAGFNLDLGLLPQLANLCPVIANKYLSLSFLF